MNPTIRSSRFLLAIVAVAVTSCSGGDDNPSPSIASVAIQGMPASGSMYVGTHVQLTATATDASGTLVTTQFNWQTSNPANATVDANGVVTGVGAGPVVVTATSGGASGSSNVTVMLVPVAFVTVTSTDSAFVLTDAEQYLAVPHDSIGGVLTNRTVHWSTSNASIATVDAHGLVTGVNVGGATITAEIEGRTGSAPTRILSPAGEDWSGVTQEWRTHQGNAAHTGFVPALANATAFREVWTKVVAPGAGLNPVATGEGKVFVSTTAYFGTQTLTTLDEASGAQHWSHDFGGIHGVHDPAYSEGQVYVTTSGHEDSYIWSFNAGTGTATWHTPYGNQWSRYYAPVVEGQVLYMAGGYFGGMYSFNVADGAQRWFRELNQYDMFSPAVSATLVLAYTGSYSPAVTASDPLTGGVVFEIPDPAFEWNGWSMNLSPVLGAQDNLLVTQGGRLISFDLAGRRIGWTIKAAFTGNVSVANSLLYVINGGQVEARNESDGSFVWAFVPPSGTPQSNIIVTRNMILFSTAETTYAVDLGTRASAWSYQSGGHLSLSRDGTLYIARADGTLVAIRLRG